MKKILSFIVVLVLLLNIICTGVWAEGVVPSISLSNAVASDINATIGITIANAQNPTGSSDWIGLYEEDKAAGDAAGAIWWDYLKNLNITSGSGTLTFDPSSLDAAKRARYVAGKRYKFVLCYNDSYNVEASAGFLVGQPSSYKLWVPSNCEKVLRDQQPPEQLNSTIKVEAARNEYEGGQVILRSDTSALSNVSVSASDLTNGSNAIPASNIKIYKQHYMHVTEPTTEYSTEGWYPDALIPLTGQNAAFNVEQGMNQGIWLTIKVPKGTSPGLYRGNLQISGQGINATVPVELTVWDFELTDESHSETSFAIWWKQLLSGHPGIEYGSSEFMNLLDKYYEFLLDYRITPMDLPIMDSENAETYAQKAKAYLQDPRITSFRIPFYYSDTKDANGYRNFDEAKNKALVNALNSQGILQKGFFYLGEIDEPSPNIYDLVKKRGDEIRSIGTNVRHLLTSDYQSELEGYVNTWCTILTSFKGLAPQDVKDIHDKGDHAWWYTCVHPQHPFPSYHTDDNMVGARVLSWMQKYYNIEGNLYWAVNIFDKYDLSQQKYVTRNVWEDPKAFPGANGDGYLLYPGTQLGIDGPVATLRLEAIRDGAEDYEYLWLLEQRMNQASKDLGIENEFKAADALKPYYDRLFEKVNKYEADPGALLQVRREIAQEIMDIQNNPKALVTFGACTETEAQLNVYTVTGAAVKVNGVDTTGSAIGSAQKVSTTVACQVGTNTVNIQVEKDGVTRNIARVFKIRSSAPVYFPVKLQDCETQDDVDKWVVNDVDVSLADENVTEGQHSMKATYKTTADYPNIRLTTDNGGLRISDWSKYYKLEFDVYNADETQTADICLKFFDKNYKAYDGTWVKITPKSSTHVCIDLSEIKGIDLSNMWIMEIWMSKRPASHTLYFDNFNLMSDKKYDDSEAIKVRKAVNEMNLDGKLDEAAWKLDNELKIKDGDADNTARFSTLWDDKYIYFGFDVKDANVVNSKAENPWDDDSIEVYIDGDLVKDTYNNHCVQYIFRYDDNNIYVYGNNSTYKNGVVHKMVKTEDGYSMEVAIPWTTLGVTASKGKAMGFTAHVNDKDVNDSKATAESTLLFTQNGSSDWQTSKNWAVIKLSDEPAVNTVSYELRKATTPIVVDGNINEAAWNLNKELKEKIGNPNNIAKFDTLWDNDNIYFAFDVTDDKLINKGSDPWDDDGIELYIDGDLAKGAYNDHTAQFIFRWNDSNFYRYNNGTQISVGKEGIVHRIVQTDKGYSMEVSIPWSTIGITPSEGKVIGITAHVNDRDVETGYVSDILLFAPYSFTKPDYSNSDNWAEFKLSGETTPGDGSDGQTGNNTPADPEDKSITMDGKTPKATVKAVFNNDKKAAEAAVASDLLDKLFNMAQEDNNGIKKVIVEVPEISGAKTYTVKFDAADLTNAGNAKKQVDLRTPVTNIIIPGNIFAQSALSSAKKIEISIGTVDKSTIDASLKSEIGDRPVIELSVTVDGKAVKWENHNAPVTISLKYNPGELELKDPEHIVVWYIDGSGKGISIPSGRYDSKTGMVTFTTTHFGKYAVAYVNTTFSDITGMKWAKNEIEVLASKGIINGISGNKFSPNSNVTRADFIVYLVKALNLDVKVDSNFSDVEKSRYYYEAAGIAKKLGIIIGTGKNTFDPDKPISRQDMMVITARALSIAKNETINGSSKDLSGYKDASSVASYAVDSVAALVKKDIIRGSNGNINPKGSVTRAQAAVVIYRLYNMYN